MDDEELATKRARDHDLTVRRVEAMLAAAKVGWRFSGGNWLLEPPRRGTDGYGPRHAMIGASYAGPVKVSRYDNGNVEDEVSFDGMFDLDMFTRHARTVLAWVEAGQSTDEGPVPLPRWDDAPGWDDAS